MHLQNSSDSSATSITLLINKLILQANTWSLLVQNTVDAEQTIMSLAESTYSFCNFTRLLSQPELQDHR